MKTEINHNWITSAINQCPSTVYRLLTTDYSICKICSTLTAKICELYRNIIARFFPSPPKSQPVSVPAVSQEIKIQKLILNNSEKEQEHITKYCEQLVEKTRKFQGEPDDHHNILQNTHREIGLVLFLAEDLPKSLDHQDSTAPRKIQKMFEDEITSIRESLQAIEESHRKAGIQDPDLAIQVAKPLEVGEALVTSSGSLNTGIISDMKKVVSINDPLDYEKDILRVLDQLEASLELHNIFDTIVKPEDPSHPINDVVRCLLGLPPGTLITDVHARQAALTALLSHLRQGPIGSCFATYLGIGLLNQRLEKCLKDFAEILRTGKAVRMVDGKPKEFHFNMNIADESRTKKFTIDRTGLIGNSGVSFHEAPGIKAALLQMGIKNIPDATRQVLEVIFKDSKDATKECNAEAILALYAKDPDQLRLGIFAFCCETNNALLRVWENLLASMAEADPSGYTNAKIVKCVFDALGDLLKRTGLTKGVQPVDEVKTVLKAKLEEKIALVYDSSVGEGGYRLDGVANPHDFTLFIDNALKKTQEQLEVKNQGDTLASQIKIISKISDFIQNNPDFLKIALWSLDDENKNIPDPVANWNKLKCLPWRFETGNNLRKTYAIELEHPIPTPTLSHPKNALDLAAIFLKFCQRLDKVTDIYRDDKPDEMVPVETPTHVFNAKVESKQVLEFLKSGKTAEAWLKDTLVETGKKTALMQMHLEYRQKVYDYIIDYKLIPEEHVSTFKSMTSKLTGPMMVQSFSSRIMKYVLDLNKANAIRSNELWQGLSGYLLNEGLPPKARNELNQAALPIGDLDWNNKVIVDQAASPKEGLNRNKKVSDMEFNVIFDVLTMTPVLAGVSSRNTDFKVVNQDEWVKVRWRFFPTIYE